MAKRVVSALVGLVILCLVCFLENNLFFSIAVSVVSIIGLNEFYHAVKQKGIKPFETLGYICCILLCLVGVVSNEKILIPSLVLSMPILFFILSLIEVVSDMKINFVDIACTLLGIIYVPMMFLFLILTWQMKNGHMLIWFIFFGAWMTDVFAYLVGKTIGKHKFSKISPNKSIEGCIGGLLGSAIVYGIYSYYLNVKYIDILGAEFNIAIMVILGAIISVISQVGDFTASAIKRYCGIKDFGEIMPGHGGVLDRFDSIIMISPFVYILFEFII